MGRLQKNYQASGATYKTWRRMLLTQRANLADGISQIWLDDLDALNTMRASPEYAEDAMNDAAQFLDIGSLSMFVASETTFIDPVST